MLRLAKPNFSGDFMRSFQAKLLFASLVFSSLAAFSQNNSSDKPTWWNKYQYLTTHAANPNAGGSNSAVVGANVDVSNECGPQSETYITVNTSTPKNLAGGSNEIFRLPMRGYASF